MPNTSKTLPEMRDFLKLAHGLGSLFLASSNLRTTTSHVAVSHMCLELFLISSGKIVNPAAFSTASTGSTVRST